MLINEYFLLQPTLLKRFIIQLRSWWLRNYSFNLLVDADLNFYCNKLIIYIFVCYLINNHSSFGVVSDKLSQIRFWLKIRYNFMPLFLRATRFCSFVQQWIARFISILSSWPQLFLATEQCQIFLRLDILSVFYNSDQATIN